MRVEKGEDLKQSTRSGFKTSDQVQGPRLAGLHI